MRLLYSPPRRNNPQTSNDHGTTHTYRDQHGIRGDATGGSSITTRGNTRRRMALVNAFALSNRGLSAPAKTHSRGGVAVLAAAGGPLLLIASPGSPRAADIRLGTAGA